MSNKLPICPACGNEVDHCGIIGEDGRTYCFFCYDVFKVEAIVKDCPNCANEGFYWTGDESASVAVQPIQQQCQWCHETTNSRFNYETRLTVAENPL